MTARLTRLLTPALTLLGTLWASPASADPISFFVTIDTSSIAGVNGSLEFQASTFAQSPPGSASIVSFAAGGGTLVGGPTAAPTGDPTVPTFGSVTGALPGKMTIAETPPFSADVFQDFNFGNGQMSFRVDLPVDDTTFALFLWDSPTSTVLGGGGNPLLGNANVNGASFAVELNSSTGAVTTGDAAVSAVIVPEPASLAVFAVAVAGLAVGRWYRGRRPAG
jgi:hypothetical protein